MGSDGYQELTPKGLQTPEGASQLNRMLSQLYDLMPGDAEGLRIYRDYGSPEGSIAANIGSLYLRQDGGSGTSMYIKESGTGNTGWVPVAGDHGLLAGLSDDDHTQYHNDARAETWHDADDHSSLSVSASMMAADSVTTASVKVGGQEQSGTASSGNWHTFTLTGGRYCFIPQFKISSTSAATFDAQHSGTLTTSYATYAAARFTGGANKTVYERHYYITSSGEDQWLFVLYNKNDKIIEGISFCDDHPCYGHDDTEETVQHPFTAYDSALHEIVLVDNSMLPEIMNGVTRKKGIPETIEEQFDIDWVTKPKYVDREIIEIDEFGDRPGDVLKTIPTPPWAKVKIRNDKVYLKRRVITKLPSNILFRSLKKK